MSNREQRVLDIAASHGAVVESLDSPQALEALGRALAEKLRDIAPDAVAFWVSPAAAVLAHVVARELGIDVLAADEDQGRLTLGRRPAGGSKVVAVDIEWVDHPGLLPLTRLVASADAAVVAAGSVLRPSAADEAAGVPLHALELSGTSAGGGAG